jgi:hypothetical protein
MLGKFIARDFIAIADEMRRYPASNENTGDDSDTRCCITTFWFFLK